MKPNVQIICTFSRGALYISIFPMEPGAHGTQNRKFLSLKRESNSRSETVSQMEDHMEQGTFKVYFKGKEVNLDKKMNLTFFYHGEVVAKLDHFPSFLLDYNELTRRKKTFSFTNIHDIIPFGAAEKGDVQNWYVLLATPKLKTNAEQTPSSINTPSTFVPEKMGFLISKEKDQNYYVKALWPFEYFQEHLEIHHNLEMIIKRIIELPDQFSEVMLII